VLHAWHSCTLWHAEIRTVSWLNRLSDCARILSAWKLAALIQQVPRASDSAGDDSGDGAGGGVEELWVASAEAFEAEEGPEGRGASGEGASVSWRGHGDVVMCREGDGDLYELVDDNGSFQMSSSDDDSEEAPLPGRAAQEWGSSAAEGAHVFVANAADPSDSMEEGGSRGAGNIGEMCASAPADGGEIGQASGAEASSRWQAALAHEVALVKSKCEQKLLQVALAISRLLMRMNCLCLGHVRAHTLSPAHTLLLMQSALVRGCDAGRRSRASPASSGWPTKPSLLFELRSHLFWKRTMANPRDALRAPSQRLSRAPSFPAHPGTWMSTARL